MQPNDLLPAAHQNNAIDYAPAEPELDDMVLVNPSGRVIEVPGELGQELLTQLGYRRVTDKEAVQLDDYKKRTHPEILRRSEMRRVREARKEVDALEAEIAGEDSSVQQGDEPGDNQVEEATEGEPKPRSRK